ncbi:MAG: hypothetical protein ABEJ36_01045 [Candidatus Nanosalina sp.]
MDFSADDVRETLLGDMREDLMYTAASIVLVLLFIGVHNYVTPDDPVRVGFTEVKTKCAGIDAGVCLGVQRQTHTTYNYDNYTEPEPGTENFYRLVESQLMLDAYKICGSDNVTGMEWTSQASYRNKTADEWLETGEVQLLECRQTFHRQLEE